MEKMNPDIKARWVAALKSGDYTQGQGRLHATSANGTNSFCCLGVLCDLANKENIVSTVEAYATSDGVSMIYDDNESWLPDCVAEWAGLDHHKSIVIDNMKVSYSRLAELNDYGATFNELATIIEEYL